MHKLTNGTILRQDFEALHAGLQRLGINIWHWQIIEEGEPNLTLEQLAIAPPKPPLTDEIEDLPPTLEEWVAAGYPAERYAEFMAAADAPPLEE